MLTHSLRIFYIAHGLRVLYVISERLNRLGSPFVQEHWQQDQPIEDAQQHNTQVHSEVVEPEQSGFSKSHDQDSDKLSQPDANKHRRSRILESGLEFVFLRALESEHGDADMRGELDGQAHAGDQVDDLKSADMYRYGVDFHHETVVWEQRTREEYEADQVDCCDQHHR